MSQAFRFFFSGRACFFGLRLVVEWLQVRQSSRLPRAGGRACQGPRGESDGRADWNCFGFLVVDFCVFVAFFFALLPPVSHLL
jgi:hypothetical protein